MAQVEVTMPKMGESITEGTVIAWHKKVGDTVEADETLLEIGTDKVDTEVPSPGAGVLKEILVEEGDTVDVGTVIAIIADEAGTDESAGDSTQSDAAESEVESEPASESAEQAAETTVQDAPEAASHADQAPDEEEPHLDTRPVEGGDAIEVVMPKMGESITEGSIIAWHKKVGDAIEEDEILLEIATDKVDTEVPSPAAGVLSEILVEEGETVEVGTAIARIAPEGAEIGGSQERAAQKPSSEPAPSRESKKEPVARADQPGDGSVAQPTPEPEPAEPVARKGDDGRFYSPLVRSIAEKEGLSMGDLQRIEGSGRDGRVTKADILAFIEQKESAGPAEQTSAPAARKEPARSQESARQPAATTPDEGEYEGRVEIIEMDRMRQIIAEHMVRSKATSAHVTSFAEVDVTNLVRVRERNKVAFQEREGVKLTFTPFFVHAAVQALADHPLFNASVEGKSIVVRKDIHVGIAVAIGKKGLVAPVIRNAQEKNLIGLAHAAADMAERARNKQLQPDELQGGTFTLTNIGSLGSIMGTPIINQPQVSILATGAIKKRPVVVEDPNLGDIIAIRHMMYLSLSYDHRIIDGAMGASFLHRFVEVLEGQDPNEEL